MFDNVVQNSEKAPSPSQCLHQKGTKIFNHLSMDIFANCSYKEKVPELRTETSLTCLQQPRLTGLLPRMMRSQIKFAGVILCTERIEGIHEDRELREGNVHYWQRTTKWKWRDCNRLCLSIYSEVKLESMGSKLYWSVPMRVRKPFSYLIHILCISYPLCRYPYV